MNTQPMPDTCQKAREWYSQQVNRLWERKRQWAERRIIVDLRGNDNRPREISPELWDLLK